MAAQLTLAERRTPGQAGAATGRRRMQYLQD